MKQPPGFVDPTLPSHVCRLHKSLYDLKQAPRAWYTHLRDFLLSIGFLAFKVDTSRLSYLMALIFFISSSMLTIFCLQAATLPCFIT